MKIYISALLFFSLLSSYGFAESKQHTHNGRQHTHPLPATGINHRHNANSQLSKKPKIAILHSHNGRQHKHPLPITGNKHSHNVKRVNKKPQTKNTSNAYRAKTYNQQQIKQMIRKDDLLFSRNPMKIL